jgi:hypothetical protein
MFIERRLRDDPNFPKPIRLSHSPHAHRRFIIPEIEQYERECAVRPAPQNAKQNKPSNPSSRSPSTPKRHRRARS